MTVTKAGHILIFAVFTIAAPLLAQAPGKERHLDLKPPPLAPCDELGRPQSCLTFNDMLRGHDSAFESLQLKGKSTYVCFEEGDHFFYVELPELNKSSYGIDSDTLPDSKRTGVLIYEDFANGQTRLFRMSPFYWRWTRGIFGTAVGYPYFAEPNESSDPIPIFDMSIDDSVISFRIHYVDTNSQGTDLAVMIRRSTRRFQTRYTVGSNQQAGVGTGKCVLYPR